MRIYCICLPHRRQYAERFFNALSPSATVHWTDPCMADQILYNSHNFGYGYTLPMRTIRPTTKYSFVASNYNAKKTKLACSISHRNALNALLASDDDACIIMEDDNEMPSEEQKHDFEYWLSWLHNHTHLFNLVNLSPCFSGKNVHSGIHDNLYIASGYCMNCYCITRKGALELLDKTLTPKVHTLDMHIPAITKAFELHPRLLAQNHEASSLGNFASPPEFKFF